MKKLIFILGFLCVTNLFAFSEETVNTEEYPDFVTFMNEYNKAVYASHAKLTLMHKPKKLQKLGKESVTGTVSGSLDYSTKVRGFSGIVTMEYKNYSDDGQWILNGFSNTKANMFANGKMFGIMNVSGKYSARVLYDNLEIVKGNAGGGFYVIEYDDGRSGKVMWNEIVNQKVPIDDADSDDRKDEN